MIQKRIQELKELRQNRIEGKANCIPFTDTFPKLSQYVPGIIKGYIYHNVAMSGVSKTQFTKYAFIWTPYIYNKLHPESKIDYKIIIFLLEESEEEFIDSAICTMLFLKFAIRIDPVELTSLRENPLSTEILDKVESIQDELDDFLSHCVIVDSVNNCTGMYKMCRNISNEQGIHYWKPLIGEGDEITAEKYESLTPEVKKTYKYSRYQANNPDQYNIVIVDNLNLLSEEYDSNLKRNLSLIEVMDRWCYNYCRRQMTKHWNWICCQVQQLANADEAQQFNYKGESIIAKVRPNLSMLADSKKTQRHSLVIMWLFAPDRYEVDEYAGYNIEVLRDTFRTVGIAKNRKGMANVEIPLYFDGASNFFRELPSPKEMNPDTYRKCVERRIKPGFKI